MEGGSVFAVGTSGDGAEVSNNIIRSTGDGIFVGGTGTIHHNLCYGGNSSIALAVFSEEVQIFNNILPNGIFSSISPCPPLVWAFCNLINGLQSCVDGYGNFSADPQFCGVGNYYLQNDSPCAPGNHPDGFDCGVIGPLPVGCGPVSVQTKTWGAVKALYRN